MLNPDQLHDYQNDIVDRLFEHDESLIVADMGAGKTAAALTAIAELIEAGHLRRVLVLAPLAVAERVWSEEAASWSHLAGLTVNVACGSAKRRLDALTRPSDVVVMNYENLQWLISEAPALVGQERKRFTACFGFDGLVFDEVSRMKGAHKSKRFKSLRPFLGDFSWRAGLTGTPAGNRLLSIYGPVYVIDRGKSLQTFTKFRQRFFEPLDPNGWNWAPLPDAEQGIYDAIAPVSYVLDPSRYDTRTPPVVRDYVVEASAEAHAASDRLMDDFVLRVEGGETITAANGGVLTGKLRQIAQGFLYESDGATAVTIDDNKLSRCQQLVDSLDGEPVIICYQYLEDLKRLRALYPDAPYIGAGVSAGARAAAIDAWNSGECPVLLIHPASAGHGLNLQHGGHHMIWYGLTFGHEEYRQTIARIARQGQTRQPYIHRLISDLAIERKMLDALDEKQAIESDLIRSLMDEHRG